MKVIKACSVCAVVATALCAVYSFGEGPKAVLNAKQLGIEDLDLDLGLDEDIVNVKTNEVAEAAPAAVVAPAAEAPVVAPVAEAVAPVAEPVVEAVVVEAAPAAEAPVVAPVVVEAVAPVVEPVVETVVVEAAPAAEAPVVAPVVVEAVAPVAEPVVEAVVVEAAPAAEAPVVEPVVVEAVAPVAEPVVEAVVVEAAPVAEVPVVEPVVVEAVAPVVEPVVEAVVVEEAAPVLEPAVEAVAPAVEAVVEKPAVEAVAEAPVAADVPAVDISQKVSELATLEESRRSLFEEHGRDCLEQGKASLIIGNWNKAIEKFKEALKFLVEKESTIAARKEAEAGLGEAFYRLSLEQKDSGNLPEAAKSARESRQYGHPKAEGLLADIENLQTNPPPPPPPKHEKRWKQPEYRDQQVDISERMKIAKEFYATEEYGKCREIVELILRDYPWHEDAVNMLRKISIAEHRYVNNERITAREDMIKDVTKAWTPRTYGRDYSVGEVKVGGQGGPGTSVGTMGEMMIIEKMRNITIPEIDFRQANITDIVTFLGEASREFDKQDIPVEERGVNIILNLGASAEGAGATPAAAGDVWGAAETTPAGDSGGVPPITINSRYVTLLSALDTIMELAKLKYRVKDNMVLIMPENAAEGKMIHRMYNVLPSLVERRNMLAPSGDGAGGGDPFSNTLQPGTTTATNTDWKKFFGELGVGWPDGSTCQHMPAIGKLVVKNTSQNLATLESVLAVLNVTPKQVEIEVRFVEVLQSDLDSLGLEWTLNDTWEIAEMKADASLPMAARRRVVMEDGSINSGFNYLNNNTANAINDGAAIMDNVATFTSILTNPELSVVLHMLSSKKNTDLLSAPKVVSQAGSPATIKVVTEYIYPQEYDVEMLESTSGESDTTTYSGAVVEPQNFTMQEVGVVLEVTPDVTQDGSMITLALAPVVRSEPIWKNYGSTYPVSTATGTDLLGNQTFKTEYVQLPMEQPFFPIRSVATSVQIYNGATVVMGGMITEERYTSEDKIPFFGDIPVIGQLFRYKYDLSEKRNLLLFVTARLVDPAGREVKDSTSDTTLLPKNDAN